MNKLQKGLVSPLVLVILAVLVIGGGAYYLKGNQLVSENKDINSGEPVTNPTQPDSKERATKPISNPVTTGEPRMVGKFVVEELGIEFQLPEEIKDLTYVVTQYHTAALFSTKSLREKYGDYCAASFSPIGLISVDQENLANRGVTPTEDSGDYKMINGRWVYFVHPHATCTDDKDGQNLTVRQISALREAFKTIRAVSN